ncbi:apolipoprotein N-acyltransferase [Octadecabacter sp. R77987]|uniref:apolipoprotein N-acyltransferase n=1 Tax=Octadecabacter sp. R77987 TaxID=3093874 RepID=UPI003671FA0A
MADPIVSRVTGLHWAARGVIFAVLGGIMALGQAPYDRPAALVLALGLTFALFLSTRTARGAAWLGWALGLGYFAHALRWIVEPFLVDVARHGWMAPFALFLMAGGGALFWAAAFWFARRMDGTGLRRVIALAVALTTFEYLRATIFTGFPWANIAQALLDTPAAPLLAIIGPHGLTLALLLVVGVSIWAADAISTLVYPLAVVALVAFAYLLPAPSVGPVAADAPIVRLIQPNAPQDEKWDPVMAPVFLERAVRMTGEGAVPDLIVWPETSVPYLLEYADPVLEDISALARGATAVIGIQRREGAGAFYNSLVVLGRAGVVRSLYDKAHLVPFGEYVPFGELMSRFGIYGMAATEGGGFSAGASGQTVDLPGIGLARPLICYEGIFAEEMNATDPRPRLLLLITNDAWFGQGAGPYQHLAQARMRAIEQGLPMVRAANTGVSAMIDARGQITGQIALGETGWLDVALPDALSMTPYARWGDWPVGVLLLVASLVGIATRKRFAIDESTGAP